MRTEQSVTGRGQVTIFERHEEGPVAIKFKEAAHAEQCNSLMHGRWFGGRQLACDFWDGTNYVVKETLEEEEKRLESFGDWLEASKSDEEAASGNSSSDDSD